MEKYRGYRIEQTENGFRITLDDDSDRHTHIKSKGFCQKLIDYVVDKKVPTRVSNYVFVINDNLPGVICASAFAFPYHIGKNVAITKHVITKHFKGTLLVIINANKDNTFFR